MASYPNHRNEAAPHKDPDGPMLAGPVPRRTSPVLLGALVIALLALAFWWYARQQDVVTVPQVAVDTTPAPARAERAATEGAASTRPDRASPAARKPAVASYRAPQPLAGNPMPEYPRTALRGGAEGSVLLRIAVDASGTPTDVEVVQRSGTRDRSFDRAAVEAARQWRFDPAQRDGKAVPSTVQLPVDFRRG